MTHRNLSGTPKRLSLWLSLSLLLASAGSLGAQDADQLANLELDELMKVEIESVFGASKYLQKVTEAPASVSVITRRDIDAFGYRTLAEVLGSVHGLSVTNDRNYSYIGVRGFQRPGDYNTRLLVLVDGHRTNDAVYDMSQFGTEFPLDIEMVDRVEIIRGPSSSLYGTNAFFAVVNIVTIKGKAINGIRFAADAGTMHTGKGSVAFGKAFANGLDVQLSTSRYKTDGASRLYFPEFDGPETNGGIAANMDGDRYERYFGTVTFRGFTLQGAYGSREKVVPTAAFETAFNNPAFKTSDARGWADLRYVREIGSQVKLTGRVYYDLYDYHGQYPSDGDELREAYLAGDYSHGKWWGLEANAEKTFFKKHKIAAGIEYRNNFEMSQAGFQIDPYYASYFEDSRSSSVNAFFVEDQYQIHEKLIANAGIRHDSYEDFGGTTNPRFGLIFKPAEKTAVKALWGSAFRAPNTYELFYESSLYSSNKALQPETIKTGELVVEHYFLDHYRLMASGYSSHVAGLINQVEAEDGTLVFKNLDGAATRGLELEFEGKWHSGISARGSYSVQHATDANSGLNLVNSARHLGTFNFIVPMGRRVQAGIDLRYVGAVQTLNGACTSPFVIPNVTISTRESHSGLSASASLYNVFNHAYGYPASEEHRQNIISQDGRTFRVGLKYRWSFAD